MFKASLSITSSCGGRSSGTRICGLSCSSLRGLIVKAILAMDTRTPEAIGQQVLLTERVAFNLELEKAVPRDTLAKAWLEAVTDVSMRVGTANVHSGETATPEAM